MFLETEQKCTGKLDTSYWETIQCMLGTCTKINWVPRKGVPNLYRLRFWVVFIFEVVSFFGVVDNFWDHLHLFVLS